MRKLILSIAVLLCGSSWTAQDTLVHPERVHSLPTVPVQVMIVVRTYESLQAPDSLLRARYRASDVARLMEMTGANVVLYGAPGSAGLMRSRGLAPDHSVLQWAGLSLNSPTLGMADFSLLPAFFFQPTVSSAVFMGSTQSGLADNVSIYPDTRNRHTAEVFADYNSLDNAMIGTSFRVGNNNRNSSTRLFRQDYNNRFFYTDYHNPDRPVVEQTSNNVKSWGIQEVAAINRPNARWVLEAWYIDRDALLPGTMGGLERPEMRQRDNQFRGRIQVEQRIFRRRVEWKQQVAYVSDRMIYDQSGVTGNLESTTKSSQAWSTTDFTLRHGSMFHLFGVDLGSVRVSYNGDRITDVGQGSIRAAVMRQLRNDWDDLSLSARLDYRTDVGWAPGAELLYRRKLNLSKHGGINARIFRRMRFPDFNELYWQPGGNSELRPEWTVGAAVGFTGSRPWQNRNELEWAIELRYQIVDDWIQWVPGEQGIWSPVNYKEVRAATGEAVIKYVRTAGEIKIIPQVRYQWQLAYGSNNERWNREDVFEMVYTPRHRFRIGCDLVARRWLFSAFGRTVSSRFTEEGNSSYYALDAYQVLDLGIGYRLGGKRSQAELRLNLDNVFNVQYELVRSYALPGRVFSINLVIGVGKTKS